MNIIPIVSKQIAYVQYDEQDSKMIVQYHTGHTQAFTNIKKDDYLMFISSTNRYDSLMKLTNIHISETI